MRHKTVLFGILLALGLSAAGRAEEGAWKAVVAPEGEPSVFEGDPALSDRIKEDARNEDARNEDGAFSLRPLVRGPDGGWRIVQDIRLRAE